MTPAAPGDHADSTPQTPSTGETGGRGRPGRVRTRGRFLEDFEPGRRIAHHWGRTITDGEAIAFATQTLQHNPLYFNREYARSLGHPDVVVCPWLVFHVVLGLSVEDISEQSTALLGYGSLEFGRPVYPGDTLTAASVVLSVRPSEKRPEHGVVRVRTLGFNQRDERVIGYERTNLVRRRPEGEARVPGLDLPAPSVEEDR
jgi:itaconyl-CoA hydratase